ncbi:MAG TPA: hypothetical protein VNN80_02885, partial [Polyangiaceae bacterium]|nr:hypothetical protein [Polyangiaceae bacterium]
STRATPPAPALGRDSAPTPAAASALPGLVAPELVTLDAAAAGSEPPAAGCSSAASGRVQPTTSASASADAGPVRRDALA